MARKKDRILDPVNVYTTKALVRIKLKPIDLVMLQSVINGVVEPEVPTYTAKVGFKGREEVYPLDAEVVKQSPEYEDVWKKYVFDKARYESELINTSLRTIFYEGTEAQHDPDDSEWKKRVRITQMKLPQDTDERWLHYLMVRLDSEEKTALSNKIITLSGVSEEMIQQAEDSFRDYLEAKRERPDDLEESEPDSQGDTEGEMVAQPNP